MLHFIVGSIPIESEPENNPLLYDAWLFKDIKTWNGAHKRAQNYALRNTPRAGMRTVLFMYTCSTTDGHTPPVRYSYL